MLLSEDERLKRIEERLDRIEEYREKLKAHPITLKERLAIHDQAGRFQQQFLALIPLLEEESRRKELKEIIRGMCTLVDRAIGVRYPR